MEQQNDTSLFEYNVTRVQYFIQFIVYNLCRP